MSPAPHDDDEDTTPARRPSSRPTTAPPRQAHRPPSALTWGLVGSLHRVEPLVNLPGQTGVVRLLPNAIKYTRPPLDLAWAPVKAEPGRFEMAWPGNPVSARSLEDVAAEARRLRAAGRPLPADHPTLRELDDGVFALLGAADKLHRHGWGLGLVTPAGVMLNPGDGWVEAVLLDLGFTWTGEFGDPPWDHSPGKPDWLSDSPAAAVWERPAVEQQFAAPAGGPFPPPQPGADVRTLARLIGWLLTGTPSRGLHPTDADVWPVLLAALDGEVPTPAALADQLKDALPSRHFTAPPQPVRLVRPREPRRSPLWPLLAVAGVLLVVAAVALYALFGGKPDDVTTGPPPANGGPPAPTDDLQKALDEYNRLPPDDLAGRLDRFPKVAATGGDNPVVGETRLKLFADWVTACETRVTTSASPQFRAEAGHELRKLTDQYRAVHDRHPPADPAQRDKEQQWLDLYDRQAEQLGWPR